MGSWKGRRIIMRIERYMFSLNKELILGEKCDFEITSQPSITLNPITKILSNSPTRKFVSLKSVGGVEFDERFVLDKLGFNLTKIDEKKRCDYDR
jgi:hypothetical protein